MSVEKEIGILGNKLEHIDAAINKMNKMNKNVDIILEKLNQQNGDLIKAEKDIEFIKKEAEENKEENEKQIEIVWKELRRREAKIKWFISTAIPTLISIMIALKYLG